MAAYFQRHTKRNRIVKDLWSRRNCLRSIGSRQQRDEKNVSVGGEGGSGGSMEGGRKIHVNY